jgi:hypothetical protein
LSPPPAAAFKTLITVFRITEISLESSWNAFAFMLSLETVAAAAERIEWDGAVKRGVSAWREITGAVVGRRIKGEGVGEGKGEGRMVNDGGKVSKWKIGKLVIEDEEEIEDVKEKLKEKRRKRR